MGTFDLLFCLTETHCSLQFYKYGLGFPVANMSQAVRTIIFDTKNHLGRNFGVLLAWTVSKLFCDAAA
jgi:Protein of unknown function (DUF3533)